MGQAKLYGQKSSGINIKGIIQDYYVYAGEKVSAGDLVEYITGIGNSTQEYEQQVRKTTTSQFDGIAKTSGVGGDSTSHNDKIKVYIKIDYSQFNLITNGDFSDGLDGYTTDTTYYSVNLTTLEGKKCVELVLTNPATTGTTKQTDVLTFPTNGFNVAGHKCYCKYECYGDSSNGNLTPLLAHTNGTLNQSLIYGKSIPVSTVEEWQMASQLVTPNVESPTLYYLSIYAQNANSELTAGMKMYFTNFRIYDLTAIFGTDNEPTKEWCDENL